MVLAFLKPIHDELQAGNYGEAWGRAFAIGFEVVAPTAVLQGTRAATGPTAFLDDLTRTSADDVVRTARTTLGNSASGGISIDEAAVAASRNGIDMRMFELIHEANAGRGIYGSISQTGAGTLIRGGSGRFRVMLTDLSLSSEGAAVNTIAHELNHIREILRGGAGHFVGSEAKANFAGNIAELFLK